MHRPMLFFVAIGLLGCLAYVTAQAPPAPLAAPQPVPVAIILYPSGAGPVRVHVHDAIGDVHVFVVQPGQAGAPPTAPVPKAAKCDDPPEEQSKLDAIRKLTAQKK
jgi:hypothetical protein